jgi:hypothetical protein
MLTLHPWAVHGRAMEDNRGIYSSRLWLNHQCNAICEHSVQSAKPRRVCATYAGPALHRTAHLSRANLDVRLGPLTLSLRAVLLH